MSSASIKNLHLRMFEVLGNVYDRSIAIVFGIVFLVLFADCENLLFDEKFLKIFLYLCFFIFKQYLKQN